MMRVTVFGFDGEAWVMREAWVQWVRNMGMIGLRGACGDRERKGGDMHGYWG